MNAPDTCETCETLRQRAINYQRADFRDGREAWADYERHRREVHHVLHYAIPTEKLQLDKRGRK